MKLNEFLRNTVFLLTVTGILPSMVCGLLFMAMGMDPRIDF